MKTFDIWLEGYLDQGSGGNPSKAHCEARGVKGESFTDAVDRYVRSDRCKDSYLWAYNKEKDYWTCWAIMAYDNEEDARRRYG